MEDLGSLHVVIDSWLKVAGGVLTVFGGVFTLCWHFASRTKKLLDGLLDPVHTKLDAHAVTNTVEHQKMHDRITEHRRELEPRLDGIEQKQAVHGDRLERLERRTG